MFEPHIEDEVWKLQQGYKVLSWKLYDSCRVHSLRMQSVHIHMLVEKKYPLTQLTLSMMLEKKLQIDYESKMAYQLLKSILKQLKNGINKKLLLVDDDGKTLPKVVSTENTESDSEVEELARTMEETKQDDDYDPFDDDLYDSHDIERGRGVKEKDLNRNKNITSSGIGVFTDSEDTMNDDSPTGVASAIREGVTPSVVDMTVEMAKQNSLDDTTILGSFPPLYTSISTTAGNAPGKSSYANITSKPTRKKVNVCTLFTPGGNGIDVVVSVDSIRAISERFANIAYGSMNGLDAILENGLWFIRNNPLILKKWHPDEKLLKEDVSTVPVWVKLYGVLITAFSEDGLSSIATKLGTPLMLDSYTCDMCMQSWGRSSYARVMVELKADVELKDNIVVVMPKITREGHYTCNVRVEYEWKPLSDSGVELVFDETANLRIPTSGKDGSDKGYGTNSLLKQWRDSYPDNDDYDLYDDDMYENHDLFKHLQSICNYLDITVRGRKKK
ncbi:zinc finger, CCHC-type containing protein [Tanacetum coccineum]